MKDRITVFSIDITINIPLRFFAFRLCRCSTVKSRSKREKLSLKTLIIPRVRLAIEFGSFFIHATILSFFVDLGDCDFIGIYKFDLLVDSPSSGIGGEGPHYAPAKIFDIIIEIIK